MPEFPSNVLNNKGFCCRRRWAIVGGGVLGMAIAEKMAETGAEVTLFEAEPALGGLASAWKIDNMVWDRHYHVILLSDFNTRALLRRLDLEDKMVWVETKTGFFTDGQLYSMSNSIEFLRFPPLRFLDKLRLAGTIFYTSRIRDWKRLEHIPVTSYLRKLSGRRTFERIWLPLLRSKLGENYSRTSAAFIWATIARMYIARQSGLKRELFGYVPNGYAEILRVFADRLRAQGVRLNTATRVNRVTPQDDSRILVETQNESIPFDEVVMTIPGPIVTQICPSLTPGEHSKLRGLEYQGIICASVLLKRPLSPYYITNITDSWVPFTAVIEISALVDREQFGGHSLVYLPKYVASNDPAFEKSDKELECEWLTALSKMYPSLNKEDIIAFKVSRVKHVHTLSTLDYSARLPLMRTSCKGIHLVNSSHIVKGTTNVNETLSLAERWVKSVTQKKYKNCPKDHRGQNDE